MTAVAANRYFAHGLAVYPGGIQGLFQPPYCSLSRSYQSEKQRPSGNYQLQASHSRLSMSAAVGGAADTVPTAKRVLSIQSHVVHGYVGNRCAVFPLQLLGFDVNFVNTVQFSNHTGYPSWKGQVMDGNQLWEIVEGLQTNGLLYYDYLISGYIGSASLLKTIASLVQLLRKQNADLVYICDPVMGDHGRLYVNPDLVPLYAENIVAVASIITPNQFEAEKLLGRKISTEQDALAACRELHSRGPHTVVITSFHPEGADDHLLVFASTIQPQEEGMPSQLRMQIPRSKAYFTGTGDLTVVLLLANLDKHPGQLKTAVEKSLASLQGILQATVKAAGDAAFAEVRDAKVAKQRELRLIENQHLLRDAPIQHRATAL